MTTRAEPSERPFSADLEAWLTAPGDKTLGGLADAFGEKSFAIALLLLLMPSALPLPTGGATHVFEVIALLIALQLLAGRRTFWLPRALRCRSLGALATDKAVPFLVRRIRWCERFSRRRFSRTLERRASLSVLGVAVVVFVLGALLAPPFSGLDTLPSLGVVLVALALILEDALIAVVGVVVGAVGVALTLVLGSAALRLL